MTTLVLMPTYNGERFLNEQISSILEQEGVETTLMASDDGSTDGTLHILTKSLHPENILINNACPLGPSQNVSLLLQKLAPYVALADQDDVWERDKLLLSMQKMKELEAQYGKEMPLLVHTDLRVVDKDLKEIAPSFFSYCKFHGGELHRLLVQNTVTGCTMLMNEALVSLAIPIPRQAIMHDWWIALVASAFGKIGVVDRPLVNYRQHGNNAVGATSYFRLIPKIKRFSAMKERKSLQAEVFFNRYCHLMTKEQNEIMQAYLNLKKESYLRRRFNLLRYQFFGEGFLRKAFTLLFG